MTRNISFIRKVIYLSAIAVLLIPLSYLCQPAVIETSTGPDGEQQIEEVKAHGKLAQLRVQHDLSQASLGEIDPASETMKLATLGLRGVAVNFLWIKAIEYKRTEAFDEASATANQIINLQPNFAKVWDFQAHNLAYNISVQFDNYKHRYEWVKRGIKFLMKGTRYNRKEPKLASYTGFIVGNKIGKSDEKKLFREMYREDEDFHKVLAGYFPNRDLDETRIGDYGYDNWKMARWWYDKAEDMVDQGALLRGEGHAVFFWKGPNATTQCAMSFEDDFPPWPEREGRSLAQQLWREADDDWHRYGERELLTSAGTYVRLNNRNLRQEELDRLRDQLGALANGARDRLEKQRRDGLKNNQPKLYEALVAYENTENPLFELPAEQVSDYYTARSLVEVTDEDVAAEVPAANQARATRLLGQIAEVRQQLRLIDNARTVTNFEYWTRRCKAESTHEAIAARQHLYDARRLYDMGHWTRGQVTGDDGKPIPETDEQGHPIIQDGQPVYQVRDGALEEFQQAWQSWADLFDNPEFAPLLRDTDGEDLIPDIKLYRKLLIDLKPEGSKELPTDFPLMPLLDYRKGEDGLPTPQEIITTHTANARQLLREAKQLAGEAKEGAQAAYEKAWAEWARLFDQDAGLMIHSATDELQAAIDEYHALLAKLGQDELPDDFPLSPYLDVRSAHQLSAEAMALADQDEPGAAQAYEAAWTEWAAVFDRHQRLMDDRRIAKHVASGIDQYRDLLIEAGETELPVDFPLLDFLNHRAGKDGLPAEGKIRTAHGLNPLPTDERAEADPTSPSGT